MSGPNDEPTSHIPIATIDEFVPLAPGDKGSQARVLLALHTATQQPVMIKRPYAYYGPEALDREAGLLEELGGHQHIISPLWRSYAGAEHPFLALPPLTPIAEHPNQLGQILVEVADALDYAHELNILHRDVNPTNIMATREGAGVLIDFAHGCRMNEVQTEAVGLAEYRAPELTGANATHTTASDIYSFARTTFVLIFGHLPQKGEQLPAAFQRALSDNPHDRPQTATEFIFSLADPDPDPRLAQFLISQRLTQVLQKPKQ